MTSQVFAVASGKGGVGKTTTVVNLGVTIRAEDHSVALVDADLGMANLATVLGIEHEPTIHDVLAGRAAIEDATVEQADRFDVVPGSRDLHGFADADPNHLRDIIDSLAETHDYVIIDTGAGLSHEDLLPLGLADQVLLVTTPDPSSVGDTRKVAGLSDILGKAVRGVVVTTTRSEGDTEAAMEEFDAELLAAIPDDPTVVEATAKGVPLEVYDSDSPAAAAYRQLAKKITGETVTADDVPAALEEPTSEGTEAESPSGAPDPEPAAGADDQPATPPESDAVAADAGTNDPETETAETSGADAAGDEPASQEPAADPEPAAGTPDADRPDPGDAGGQPTAEEVEEDAEPEPSADSEAPDAEDAEGEEDQAEEASDDEADDEESPGFFGRLFGVFR